MVKRRDGETVKGRKRRNHTLRITLYALRITHYASRITDYAITRYTLSSPMPYSSAYLSHLWERGEEQ